MGNYEVLFANRKDCLINFGGDTIQMLKTKENLERKYGLRIKICLDENEIINNKSAEIVHVFNIQTIDETNRFIKACKMTNKKIALSTIFWDLSHSRYTGVLSSMLHIYSTSKHHYRFKDFGNITLGNLFALIKGIDSYNSKSYKQKRRYALLESDVLLPNSGEELDILCRVFDLESGLLSRKAFVVPNAVDNVISDSINTGKYDILGKLDNFVLEVGRIENIKNQANVVKALEKDSEIPIIFIGKINDFKYFKYLKEISGKRGNVYFIEHISHEDMCLFYKKAKVHVLPSFRESPGLSSLEALLNGCEIVVSSNEYCPVEYYGFTQYAHICNPYDKKSIRKAVFEAFGSPKNTRLPQGYKSQFSYESAADKTYEAYKTLMKQ